MVGISFGNALFVMDGAAAIVALPTIARELGIGAGEATSIIIVYQLMLVMVLLPFANMGDRIGHRTLYQIGQVVYLFATCSVLFVDSFPMLLVARAGQALGAGMALSVSAAMLREIYPARLLGSAMGLNSVVVASSAAIAPTLGGWIVAHFDWQWVFVAAAPLAVISLGLGRTLPDPFKIDREPEILSGIWSAMTFLLVIGGIQIATHGGAVIGSLLGVMGVISAFLLVMRERRRSNPVLPVDLLAKPVIGLSALAAICAFVASGSILISLPFRLEEGFGYTPDEVGLLLLPFPMTMLLVAPAAGWLSDRIAPTKLGVTGMVLAMSGMLLLAFLPDGPTPFDVSWRLSLCALGFGLFFAPNSRLLIGQAPRERSAAAGGLLSTSRLVGQALAAALVGILLTAQLGLGPWPLVLASGLALVAAACSLARFVTVTRAGGTMASLRNTD